MLKKLVFVVLVALPIKSVAAEFDWSVGAGLQYSGIIGTQLGVKHNHSKYFVSLGLPGYSVGMQTMIGASELHSVGFSVGEIEVIFNSTARYGVVTYNYHPSGFNNKGWVFGGGVGIFDEKKHRLLFTNQYENPSAKAILTLDVGYKF